MAIKVSSQDTLNIPDEKVEVIKLFKAKLNQAKKKEIKKRLWTSIPNFFSLYIHIIFGYK